MTMAEDFDSFRHRMCEITTSNLTGLLKGKKGVCMALKEEGHKSSHVKNLPKIKCLYPYWFYNWGTKINDCVEKQQCEEGTAIPAIEGSDSPFIDFLPMIWGCNKHFELHQEEVTEQSPCMVLAFNEPDNKPQSNLSVERVIEVWPELEESCQDVTVLVSPSAGNSLCPWFESFMEQANEMNLRVDAIGVHHYGGPNPDGFKLKLKLIHEKFHLPLLITEMAVADWNAKNKTPADNKHTPEKVLRFMKEVLPWMEEQDWILGYAWFPFDIGRPVGTSSALFDEDDKLTALGEYYSSFRG